MTLSVPTRRSSDILGSFTEHVLENAVFDNDGSGRVKIKIRVENGSMMVTALYTSATGNARDRWINYRQEMASWEEQIDLLNRLTGSSIKREKHSRRITA